MKKLMTMLAAAVVAVGAFAEAFETGTAFSLASGDPGALSTAVIQELGVQDPVAAGQSGFWMSLNDDVKVTAFGAEIAPAQMQRFKDADFEHINYLTVKTTLGNPVLRYAQKDAVPYSLNEVGAAQIYFQGNVKFTAFDEDPSAEYSDAKILLYVKDLSQFETPSAETNLYAKVGENEYKVASGIDIDAWHTLTIKTMKIADGKLGFVVFRGDEATDVLSADTTVTGLPTDLDPVAQYYASKNQLFPAGATGTTITEVGFDGQGSVDQIAFSTNVLIPDPSLQTITFGPNIATLILSNETTAAVSYLTTSPTNFRYDAANKGAYVYSYIAKPGHISKEYWSTLPEMGSQATIAVGDASEAKAAFVVDTTTNYYSDVAGAVNAADVSEVDGTLTLLAETVTDTITIANENSAVITIDLNGKTLNTGSKIAIDCNTAVVIDGNGVVTSTAETAVYGDDTCEIKSGTFNGTVATEINVSGGKFSVADNGEEECALKNIPTGKKWQKVESDTYFMLVDAAVVAALPTGEFVIAGVAAGDKFAEGESIAFTVTPNQGFKVTSVKVNGTVVTDDSGYTYEVKAADVESKILTIAVTTEQEITEVTVTLTADKGIAAISNATEEVILVKGNPGEMYTVYLYADGEIAIPVFKADGEVCSATFNIEIPAAASNIVFTAIDAKEAETEEEAAAALVGAGLDSTTVGKVKSAKALAAWWEGAGKGATPTAINESNYVKASVDLGVALIDETTPVNVDGETFAIDGSELTFTVKIAGVTITSENIENYVKVTSDVADWTKVTGIEITVNETGVVTVDGGENTAVFSKVEITVDKTPN